MMKQEKHVFLRFFAFLRCATNKRLNFDTPYSFFLSIHGRGAKTEPTLQGGQATFVQMASWLQMSYFEGASQRQESRAVFPSVLHAAS